MQRSYIIILFLLICVTPPDVVFSVAGTPAHADDSDGSSQEARRERVRAVIQESQPTTDPSVIDVWVDEYIDLDIDEVRFLMEQKRRTGGSQLTSEFFSLTTENSLPDGDIEREEFSDPRIAPLSPSNNDRLSHRRRRPAIHVFEVIQSNLENMMTVGYRCQTPVTIQAPGTSSGLSSCTIISFESGRMIATGDPLHLAIQDDGPVFFELENGMLTRNGMFVRLTDGRIGLSAGGHSVSLKKSPTVSADLTAVSIDDDGSIHDSTQGDEALAAVSVVRVLRPHELRTSDSVYFRVTSETEPLERPRFRSGVLELGNVNAEQSIALLQAVEAALSQPASPLTAAQHPLEP